MRKLIVELFNCTFLCIKFINIDRSVPSRSPSKRLVHGITQGPVIEEKGKLGLPPARPPRPYDNKVQSLGAREPRQAWGEGNPSDEFVFMSLHTYIYFLYICDLSQGKGPKAAKIDF